MGISKQNVGNNVKPVLDGIALLDLSTGIAGPYAAMLMADMGAECVKIEPGDGDPTRGLPGFLVWNRGKRSVALNLETEEGQEIIYQLVKKADVVTENFSPRQAKFLGLDYESLSRLNPRLIYCAVPLFGESGPLSEKPGNDGVVSALAGMMAGQGGLQRPPVFIALPFASYGAAFLTAYGTAAALYVRETSGTGQKVEVSLLAGALAMQSAGFISAETITPIVSKRNTQQGGAPTYRLYEAQDDWFMLACGNTTFWNKLCIALDRVDLMADPRFENAPWGIADEEHRNALTDLLWDIFCQKPRAYWLDFLAAADVPCAPVSRREEFMEDPQVLHNQMIVPVDDPQFGRTMQMGIPITLVENPTAIKRPAPRLGEHTDTVIRGLGYSEERIAKLKDRDII